MANKEQGFSVSCSCEVEPTEENKEAFQELLDDCRKAEDKQRQRIVSTLIDASQRQVDEYIAQGAIISDTDTFKAIIYNAMAEGWNLCFEYHKEKILHGL